MDGSPGRLSRVRGEALDGGKPGVLGPVGTGWTVLLPAIRWNCDDVARRRTPPARSPSILTDRTAIQPRAHIIAAYTGSL